MGSQTKEINPGWIRTKNLWFYHSFTQKTSSKTQQTSIWMKEGCQWREGEAGRKGKQVAQGQGSVFVLVGQQLSRECCRRGKTWRGKNIKRRGWTLTFLPSRKLRAVPMLATQWILFSFLPCSHGCKGNRTMEMERKKERKKTERLRTVVLKKIILDAATGKH